MVFSDGDKAIFKHEKGFTPCRVWKDNPEKDWDKTSVKRIIKRLVKYTMGRQKGSGCPQTATTRKGEESVEDLVCPQEDKPVCINGLMCIKGILQESWTSHILLHTE